MENWKNKQLIIIFLLNSRVNVNIHTFKFNIYMRNKIVFNLHYTTTILA